MSAHVRVNRPAARTDEEKRAKVQKALRLLRDGYEKQIIASRTGTALHHLRRWAADLGIEWPRKR